MSIFSFAVVSTDVLKLWLNIHYGSDSHDTVLPRRFLCCSSSLLICRCIHMWRLLYHYLFPISPYFGVSGRLCFVIVTFPGYLHLYSSISSSSFQRVFYRFKAVVHVLLMGALCLLDAMPFSCLVLFNVLLCLLVLSCITSNSLWEKKLDPVAQS